MMALHVVRRQPISDDVVTEDTEQLQRQGFSAEGRSLFPAVSIAVIEDVTNTTS